jgi:hypothetical protein
MFSCCEYTVYTMVPSDSAWRVQHYNFGFFFPLSMLEKVECGSDCKTYHPLLLMWIFDPFYCRSMNYNGMRILLYMNCWVHIILDYHGKSCELSKEGVGNAQLIIMLFNLISHIYFHAARVKFIP